MKNKRMLAAIFALLAAALYAINIPFSKLLMAHAGEKMMAGFLYLGAGAGMLLYRTGRKLAGHADRQAPLTRKEMPYTVAMIVLDIAAPIFLMYGLRRTAGANASLLNNFEIVATSLIALLIFKEKISRRLWLAIMLVIASSVILTFEGAESLNFNAGSLYVLAACVCWGFENNCTRMLSHKSSEEIVVIKGLCSGAGALIIALCTGEALPGLMWMLLILLLGFVSYGLSINFYIMAQKDLGATKTSAYYAVAPFLGVLFSVLLGERLNVQFFLGLAVMIAATVLLVRDTMAE